MCVCTCVCVHLCLPRSVALSRVRTCTRLETQVSFGESRAREKRRDARGSAVRARLTEGESRYWEQSAGEVCSPRLPPLSPPPGCRVALALSLSTLLPPPPPPIAFPSLSSSPFSCLSDSLPLPTRSVSFAPIVRLFSLSLSLSLSPPPSLSLSFSFHSAHSRLPFDAEQARNERNRNLSSAVASSVVSSCAAAGCLPLDAGTAAAAAASAASTLPLSISILYPRLLLFHAFLLLTFLLLLPILSLSLFLSLSFLVRPQHHGQKSLVAYLHEKEGGREREREGFSLHRPRSSRRHCPKLVGEMARHSFRHRNQLARLLFHTATHPLRDHRSHPTYPPLFSCVPDESRTRE